MKLLTYMTAIKRGLLLFACIGCSSCATKHYDDVEAGALTGKLTVEWMEPDMFLYRPHSTKPLTFTRVNGEQIRPEVMFTDGGSIPRPFWVFPDYSPWGYGPAFIMHDWLFVMQDCSLPGADQWTIDEAALVMSEVMKTMMEKSVFEFGSVSSVYTMYKAVQSQPAREAWTDKNCLPIPDDAADDWRPSVRIEFDFDD